MKINKRIGQSTQETVVGELLLANGRRVNVETSTRQAMKGKKSTFVSIDTGCFRIRVVQRISLHDLMPQGAQIGLSTIPESADLAAIETLALSLEEAIKIAKQLNETVEFKTENDYSELRPPDVESKVTG